MISFLKTNKIVIFSFIIVLSIFFMAFLPVNVKADINYQLQLSPNFEEESLWSYNDSYKPIPSSTDCICLNELDEEVFIDLKIEVMVPSSTEYVLLDNANNLFSEYGTYKIRYSVFINDELSSNYCIRTIEVVDGNKPELLTYSETYILNAALNTDENNTKYYKHFRAYKNKTLNFSTVYAYDKDGAKEDLTDEITLKSYINGAENLALPIAYEYNRYAFSFKPDTVGTYMLVYSVSDGRNSTSLCYEIEVKDEWVLLKDALEPPKEMSTEDALNLNAISGVSIFGEKLNATNKTEILLNNQIVYTTNSNIDYTFINEGIYTLKYTTVYNDESDTKTYTISVKDKTKPVLNVSGDRITKAKIGETITLPTVTVSDNDDKNISYSLKIILGDEVINYYDNKFMPQKNGTYHIEYASKDYSDNVSTFAYDIVVGGDVVNNKIKIIYVIIAAIAFIFLITAILVKSKKKGSVKQ